MRTIHHPPSFSSSSSPLLLLLLFLFSFFSSSSFFFLHVSATHRYVGCYQDKVDITERDLGSMVVLAEGKISPSYCESICGRRHHSRYFGLQWGSECWCGDSMGKWGAVNEGLCNTPCSGDKATMCGGSLVNSVYEITTNYPLIPPHSDGRPLLGLVMIVKDEAHTLPQTLMAIKPWIDVYYILDTGSTDGTQDAIRRTLGANKGEVWEEPFIDYGTSRNRALEIASQTKNLGGPPVFSLMLSADETVYNGEGLRLFCEEHRDKAGGVEEAYYVQMDVGWRFDSARLSRTSANWRYQGRVHEYLTGPHGRGTPTLRVPDTYIKFKATDQERRQEREYIILRILQEEVAAKPNDARSSFYLARTFNVVGNHSESLKEFERRVSLGGWKEEVYESLFAIAWQKDALHRPWHEVQQAFLDAHSHSSERAEPLFAIAQHWWKEKNAPLAYVFASHAATLPYPTGASLWVQNDVYSWQANYLLGLTAIDIRNSDKKAPKEGCKALLKVSRVLSRTQKEYADVMKQLSRYRVLLGNEVVNQLECEVDPTNCKAVQAQRDVELGQSHVSTFTPAATKQQVVMQAAMEAAKNKNIQNTHNQVANANHGSGGGSGSGSGSNDAPLSAKDLQLNRMAEMLAKRQQLHQEQIAKLNANTNQPQQPVPQYQSVEIAAAAVAANQKLHEQKTKLYTDAGSSEEEKSDNNHSPSIDAVNAPPPPPQQNENSENVEEQLVDQTQQATQAHPIHSTPTPPTPSDPPSARPSDHAYIQSNPYKIDANFQQPDESQQTNYLYGAIIFLLLLVIYLLISLRNQQVNGRKGFILPGTESCLPQGILLGGQTKQF